MSLLDRVVREARRDLEPMEGLIGCVQGREYGGRRRMVVIATDKRVLLVSPRRGAPAHLSYSDIDDVTYREGDEGLVLRIVTSDQTFEVDHILERSALDLLVQLVTTRCTAEPIPQERPPKVRIIS